MDECMDEYIDNAQIKIEIEAKSGKILSLTGYKIIDDIVTYDLVKVDLTKLKPLHDFQYSEYGLLDAISDLYCHKVFNWCYRPIKLIV